MGSIYKRGDQWWVRYRDIDRKWKGKNSHKPNKAEAKTYLSRIESRVADGKVGVEEKTDAQIARGTITIAALAERFIAADVSPEIRDPKRYRMQRRGALNRVLGLIGNRSAASITSEDVELLRGQIPDQRSKSHKNNRKPLSASSVKNALDNLSAMYDWGIKRQIIDCKNPCADVEFPKGKSSSDYYSQDELMKLEAATRSKAPQLYTMIAVATFCGLRKGELFGLRWSAVDLDRALLSVEKSYNGPPKNGHTRYVPMHSAIVAILAEWKHACPEFQNLVFPVKCINPGKSGLKYGKRYRMGKGHDDLGLTDALTVAGCHVPKKPWHCFRHSFCSHGVMSGIAEAAVQTMLGHATQSMTQKYRHLAPEFLAGQVMRLGGETAAIERKQGTLEQFAACISSAPLVRAAIDDTAGYVSLESILGGTTQANTIRANRNPDLKALSRKVDGRRLFRRDDVVALIRKRAEEGNPIAIVDAPPEINRIRAEAEARGGWLPLHEILGITPEAAHGRMYRDAALRALGRRVADRRILFQRATVEAARAE